MTHRTVIPLAEPAHWHQATNSYAACMRCQHGQGPSTDRQCSSQAVMSKGHGVPVAQARQRGGACGPEAEHLDFPGLKG